MIVNIIIIDIYFNVVVIGMPRMLPGMIDEGFWSPGMEDCSGISVIEDDGKRPFARILGEPHIRVIGSTKRDIKMVDG